MNTVEFKTGDLASFRYAQPLTNTDERRTGIVLSVRDVRINPVRNRYYRWHDSLKGTFKRSGNFFTVKHVDSSIQVYYEGRCFAARRPNILQRVWFKIQSHWPQYFIVNA